MNFGSGFVYHSDSDGEGEHGEVVEQSQLSTSFLENCRSAPRERQNEGGQNEDILSAPQSAPQRTIFNARRGNNRKKKAYRQRVDVNVVEVPFSDLGKNNNYSTGEPISCKNCGVFFSHLSTIKGAQHKSTEDAQTSSSSSDDQEVIWKCEFCQHSNVISDLEELPDTDATTLDYILAPPPTIDSPALSEELGIIIPCVDVSGSMCISSEVEGDIKIRGDAASRLNNLRTSGDEANQYLPNEKRGVSYVSRLQCVQGAISSLIENVKEQKQETRIGLVTFSDKVSIHGDASGQPFVVSGNALDDYDTMVSIGKTHKQLSLESPSIASTAAKLSERLFALEEGGGTGLGPAVVAAISAGAEFNLKTNSNNAKVVLATDGLANIGIGSLENEDSTVDSAMKADEFYTKIGKWASESNVTVDVFGIEGDTCDIENLSTLADCTGGSVNLVNPVNLLRDFDNMCTSQKVASNVFVKVYLHIGVEFREENDAEQKEGHSFLVKEIGVVTEDTRPFTFEFNVKRSQDLKRLNLQHLPSLPFQVHIEYTTGNGMRCVRVISAKKDVTNARDVAEKSADVNVLSGHVQSRCAEFARKGHYTKSRVSARAWGNVFNRAMTHQLSESPRIREETEMKLQSLNDVDHLLGRTVAEEMRSGDYLSSDDEMDEEEKTRQKFKRKQQRSKNDDLSSKLFSLSKGGL
jgi:hypothetical protein